MRLPLLLFISVIFIIISCEQQDSEILLTPLKSVAINDPGDYQCFISKLDVLPRFPGGTDSLQSFIKANLYWEHGHFTFEGTVYVSFVVTKTGDISSIKIVKGSCESCNQQAIQLVKSMPKWTSGQINSATVDCKMILPIRYKL